MMVSARIESNYRTFCIVAMSCRKGFYGVSLIKELKENAVGSFSVDSQWLGLKPTNWENHCKLCGM